MKTGMHDDDDDNAAAAAAADGAAWRALKPMGG